MSFPSSLANPSSLARDEKIVKYVILITVLFNEVNKLIENTSLLDKFKTIMTVNCVAITI